MSKAATGRTRAIQTPGEPVQAVVQADETVTEGEQSPADAVQADPAAEVEAAQVQADETKRPVLTSEGWVVPNVPVLPNLNRF